VLLAEVSRFRFSFGEKPGFDRFRFSEQHQNQLLMSSDNAHTRRACPPCTLSFTPDVCARCLLNANYMGGPLMAHC